MNRKLSRHDRINAVLVGHKVEEFKGRHAYLHALSRHREEYGTFWLRSDNSTFGHGFGRMMGFKEIVPAYFGKPLTMREEPPDQGQMAILDISSGEKKPRADRPTRAADIFGELEVYGHNDKGPFSQSCHVLGSPVIEVADDGKSARSYYITPGTMGSCNGEQGGRSGAYLWERYGSDFVFRDGRWWWFHEQVLPDIQGSLDNGNWAQDNFIQYLEGKLNLDNTKFAPKISDLRQAHTMLHIVQTVQDTVPLPKHYTKLDENNTYSPGMNDFSGPLYPNTQSYGDYLY